MPNGLAPINDEQAKVIQEVTKAAGVATTYSPVFRRRKLVRTQAMEIA